MHIRRESKKRRGGKGEGREGEIEVESMEEWKEGRKKERKEGNKEGRKEGGKGERLETFQSESRFF